MRIQWSHRWIRTSLLQREAGWTRPLWLAMVLIVLVISLAACTPSETAWESGDLVTHPLVGRIWDVQAGQFVPSESVIAATADANFVLLGEVHSNPDHQRLQGEVIEALGEQGQQPALVFEMLEQDDQAAIDDIVTGPQPTTAALAAATDFATSGWDWAAYEPLFALALEQKLPLLGGNASIEEVRQVAQAGQRVLTPERQHALRLTDALPDPARVALVQAIVDGHCGYLTPDQAGPLADAQRLRDATMADVMLGAAGDPVVLIAGSGHVRSDYGVPWYVRLRQPEADIVAVGFVEVRPDAEQAQAYLDETAGPPGMVDYLWFTPRFETEDPCEAFRRSLEQMNPEQTPAAE